MSSTLTSYAIPPLDSQFRDEPHLPSIRQTPTASWPTVTGTIPNPAVRRPALAVAPILNKVYFTKKILKETVERYNPNTLQHETAKVWEIPFSVDVNEPVTELVQRIQAVMTARGIYRHWDINMNTFIIDATQEIISDDVLEIQR